MPKITQLNQIDVTPEKFLRACSPNELKEVELLLSSNHYQRKMNREAGELEVIKLSNH